MQNAAVAGENPVLLGDGVHPYERRGVLLALHGSAVIILFRHNGILPSASFFLYCIICFGFFQHYVFATFRRLPPY
jgi:hypothetical protein